jgi:putative transposase
MRPPRLQAPPGFTLSFHHCISRFVDRRFLFSTKEKKVFLGLMRKYERLCGVRVLTYCIMDNHFHVLVAVPQRPEVLPTEEELLGLIQACFGKVRAIMLRNEWNEWRGIDVESGNARVLVAMERWFARMWNISEFMKGLKQAFSQWYNATYERLGTLWESRFKSTLVQGGDALLTVAAYIDLNPVRADIVKDPKDYRWSGYGACCGGDAFCKRRLTEIVGTSRVPALLALAGKEDDAKSWKVAMREYRRCLLLWGVEGGMREDGSPIRKGMDRQKAAEELERKDGELGALTLLKTRVRYFSDGVAIGGKEFVESVFQTFRDRFGKRRKEGARRMRGGPEGMFVLRDLRG